MARLPSGSLVKREHVERYAMFMREAGDGTLIVRAAMAGCTGRTVARGSFTLPGAIGPRMAHHLTGWLARVIVIGDAIIYVFDLSAVMPARIAATQNTRALFVDDDTLLMFASAESPWQWLESRRAR
jgi:hypothetical protein